MKRFIFLLTIMLSPVVSFADEVVQTPYGIEHHLVEINSKNIIVLNDKPIQRGDILKIKFGDKMTLGKTDIYLEETDDEATQIV